MLTGLWDSLTASGRALRAGSGPSGDRAVAVSDVAVGVWGGRSS